MEEQRKVFIICPVRGHDKSETGWVVNGLEGAGWAVYWPPRDTDQGASELEICRQNRAAIEAADVVAVVYNEESQGVHFDLGMAFALRKPVAVIKGGGVYKGGKKSFAGMIDAWEGECGGE